MRIIQLCDLNMPDWLLKEIQKLQEQEKRMSQCKKEDILPMPSHCLGELDYETATGEGLLPQYKFSITDEQFRIDMGILGLKNTTEDAQKCISINYREEECLIINYAKPDYDWSDRPFHTNSFVMKAKFNAKKYDLNNLKASLVDSILTITAPKIEHSTYTFHVSVE